MIKQPRATYTSDRASPDLGGNGATAAALLASLRAAHANLLSTMEVLKEITRQREPSRLLNSNARWRISQASFQRRKLWVDCYRHLRPLVSPSDLTTLESLRLADMELQRSSAAHVERWRPECLQREWAAYCEASCAIRARMNAAIELEKRLLYPLLARYSAHRSARSLA